ncbi:MAG: DUF3817 domain-containing protein [Myxococcota bacterium]
MNTWIAWKLLKLVSLVVLAGGVFGAMTTEVRGRRIAMTYGYTVPGLAGTWTAGWLMMKEQGVSVTAPWILAAIAASTASLHGAFVLSHRPVIRPIAPILAVGGLFGAVALMVARPLGGWMVGALVAGGLLVAIPLSFAGRAPARTEDTDAQWVVRGFRWVAWGEGATLLFLLLVTMPLKYLAGVDIQLGTGWIGWLHGVFVVVYVQSLASTAHFFGWSWRRWATGFLAALLPAGTFVFERAVTRHPTHRAGGGAPSAQK